jgi:hypothetical protein
MRRLGLALLVLLALCGSGGPAAAQGCGPTNPNCIVPTRPPGTNDNTAASTAFVHTAGSSGVTSVAAGCGSTTFGPPITTTGTIAAAETVNAQTGTTYTIANADCGSLTTLSNAASIAVSLPQAGTGGNFPPGWYNDVCDLGAGTATITPTTSTINGAATLVLGTGKCVRLATDGSNYQVYGALLASLAAADQVLSGGANVTSLSLATGNVTIDCGARPLQFITNGGAFTITAPANDGSCMLLVTNNASAGAITFTSFTVGGSTGDALDTTNTHKFTISIWRINSISGYRVAAHQ